MEEWNFSKCNTPAWVFFPLFKLHKMYQIAQNMTGTTTNKESIPYYSEFNKSGKFNNLSIPL